MDKEFYKRFNKIEYSDDEINEYLRVSTLTDEEAVRISGAVRLKYGQKQIKYNAQKITELLDDDEEALRIIKFRDIESLGIITVCSAMGLTTLKSNDFGVFKMICFTNKRMFFTDTNVLNEALTIGWINNDEIIGTKFTTKKVLFDKKDHSKIRFSRWTKGVIASEGILLATVIGLIFKNDIGNAFPIAFLFFLAIKFQQKYLDRYVIIMKGNRVFSLLIATYNYDEDKKFLLSSSKNIND